MGLNPAQGIKRFSSNENVIQTLSVLGPLINLIDLLRLTEAWTVNPFVILLWAEMRCWLERLFNLYVYIYTFIYINWKIKDDAPLLCDSEFRAEALVICLTSASARNSEFTENRCVIFYFSTYVCFALLPQHWALYAKVHRTSICIYRRETQSYRESMRRPWFFNLCIYISWKIKDDASILCNSEFRVEALVRQILYVCFAIYISIYLFYQLKVFDTFGSGWMFYVRNCKRIHIVRNSYL